MIQWVCTCASTSLTDFDAVSLNVRLFGNYNWYSVCSKQCTFQFESIVSLVCVFVCYFSLPCLYFRWQQRLCHDVNASTGFKWNTLTKNSDSSRILCTRKNRERESITIKLKHVNCEKKGTKAITQTLANWCGKIFSAFVSTRFRLWTSNASTCHSSKCAER